MASRILTSLGANLDNELHSTPLHKVELQRLRHVADRLPDD